VPILAAKLFTPPPPPGAILRPRLIDRLNQGLTKGSRLTLISASAGFGKSTLASQWLAESERPVAWLSLDEEDHDPLRFIAYLVSALQTIQPELAKDVLAALQSPQPPQTESLLPALLNEVSAISVNFILVLDDYHSLDSQPVDKILAFLLRHQPPNMHIVISSREDPHLPLTRLRARGQLTELRTADLRFLPAEAADFLNQVMGLNLSADHIAALEKRTEGWIAGLQLAAISMQGHEDVNAFIRSFTGSHRFVLDYLVEEVLQQQPDDVKSFLLRTSILDRLCGSLCDAILDGPPGSGQKMLEVIEQANLFIVPLDSERLWYRYHHLFAELLRQRLEQSLSKEEISLLQIHASEWHERSGQVFEAFRYATAANDIARAERLMENSSIGLHSHNVAGPVLDWLNSLPRSVRDARPRLWVRSAAISLMSGKTSSVADDLNAAENALSGAIMDTETRELVGQIASARAVLAFFRYDPELMLAQANRALEFLDPEGWTYRFNAHWVRAAALRIKGDRSEAALAAQDCMDYSRRSPSVFSKTLAYLTLGISQEINNQLIPAAESYRKALVLGGESPQPSVSEAHFGLARIFFAQNDLIAAEEHAQLGLRLGRQFYRGFDRFTINEAFMIHLKLAQGDTQGASIVMAAVDQLVSQNNFIHCLPEVAHAKINLLIEQGALSAAAQLAQEHDLPLGQAKVLILQENAAAALDLLDPFCRKMNSREWKDHELKGLVLKSVALYQLDEMQQGLDALSKALALAEPGGYIRVFIEGGKPIAELLSKIHSQNNFSDYAGKLLDSFGEFQIKKQRRTIETPGGYFFEPLSVREQEVLQLIAQGLSNREICDRLFLALDTVKGHNRRIFEKLQVRSRTEAAVRARELGVL
jgi:LuxR family maltose regulon positive regulatory protein